MLKYLCRAAALVAAGAACGSLDAAEPVAARSAARAIHAAADQGCALEIAGQCLVGDVQRLPVWADVVRYRFEVRIGPGPFDVVRMHRVVKESRPYVPVHTRSAVFALHGCCAGFEGSFLPNILTGQRPPEEAMPVYLAQRGVDVWGVDLGWILAPAQTTDFSSFEGWGFDKEVAQTRAGLAIARAVRAVTSGDPGRVHLLGWSYGAQIGYVLVGAETQLPGWRRHVKGFIPVDMVMKFEPGTLPEWVCGAADWYQLRLDAGDYGDYMAFYAEIGALALADPSGVSPYYGPLTNEQAALVVGANPGGLTPTFHQAAGVFDETGMPVGFQYVGKEYFFHFLAGGPSGAGAVWWAPVRTGLDQFNTWCDVLDVPFDDHLANVRVPTLYLGAAGGFGEAGRYSTTLLGSRDVSVHVVKLHPSGEESVDFGHSDLWVAENAETLVWKPILDWIRKH